MKLYLTFATFMLLPGIYQASLAEITRAINAGDADALGRFFDQTVEIALQDQEDVYDRASAVGMVKKFFAENKPRSFNQVHQGASKDKDSQYCIGNLVTGDATYRVYIYMEVSGDRLLIQELRFEKE